MSPPLFLHDDLAGAVAGSTVELGGAEGRHAATVRRVQVGGAVELADGRGTRASCRVLSLGQDRVRLEVLHRVVEPEPALRLVLVQAIAKGDRGELAVQLATEVGVDEVLPWAAARCVVQWEGARGQRALERWRSTAREAGKQSRRARHPLVGPPVDTPALLDRMALATALVLHEDATAPLAVTPLPERGDLLLVVGPEGGITDGELARFEAAGARSVRFGTSVLRTSTAGVAAVSVVSARTARWA